VKLITPVFFLIFFYSGLIAAGQETSSPIDKQSKEIKDIFQNERSVEKSRALMDIINTIDDTYSDIYGSLKKGKKIVIFIDPAHGKLKNGQWQGGAATRRQSCTNKPEEYYSIIIAREMYKKLKANPHIEVKTTPDFLDVLEERGEIYNDIPFTKTTELAAKAEAFMIITEHLNNVSVMDKADGILNIPGIHITRSLGGQKMLRDVGSQYRGFLTLYNMFDAGGFSKEYAQRLRDSLVSKGIKPNNWEQGVVGDDRFTYFLDYPISIIYESGFISNPEEEKLLASKEYAVKLTDSQYTALLSTIKDVFKVDISSKTPKQLGKKPEDDLRVEMMKLARIAVYYLKCADTQKALATIDIMEKKSGKELKPHMSCFAGIKNKIEQTEKLYSLAASTKNKNKKKKQQTAGRYYKQAYDLLSYSPVYKAYKDKYSRALGIRKSDTLIASSGGKTAYKPSNENKTFFYSNKAPKLRTILLPIEDGQSIETAIEAALAPDTETLTKLSDSFRKAKEFGRGIYLISINNKLKVTKVQKVSGVLLDPWKYQNQQYLKNSYFAPPSRDKSL
jgi:N-acetylmuramoyl-L-alanine amidase